MTANGTPHIELKNLCAYYGAKQVLKNVSFTVPRHSVIGVIGPANSGKTTMLKAINRTLDFIGGARFTGDVEIEGESVAAMKRPNELRRRIGPQRRWRFTKRRMLQSWLTVASGRGDSATR